VNSFFCVNLIWNWRRFWKCEIEKSSFLIINRPCCCPASQDDFQVCSVYQDERDVISSRSVVNKTHDGMLNYSTRTVRVVIIMAWKLLLSFVLLTFLSQFFSVNSFFCV
jgi:hypothetical protein